MKKKSDPLNLSGRLFLNILVMIKEDTFFYTLSCGDRGGDSFISPVRVSVGSTFIYKRDKWIVVQEIETIDKHPENDSFIMCDDLAMLICEKV
jgi:hypothetical protein